jgi:hypothetical protein
MDTVGFIDKIASGDLTEDEQLALLAQVETSIQLRKQAKQVQQDLDHYEQAVEIITETINTHKAEVDASLEKVYSYVRQPGPAGKDGKPDYKVVTELSRKYYEQKEQEDAQKVKNILGIYW